MEMIKNKTKRRLVSMARLEQAAGIMKVLAHPHRLRICDLLLSRRLTVGEIACDLDTPPNAVSQHLNLMKAHGILASERDGKEVYYCVVHPSPMWLLECISGHSE